MYSNYAIIVSIMAQTKQKKKILKIGIVQPELFYPRGAERQVCELAHHLNKLGHQITIYTFEVKQNYPFLYLLNGIKIVSLNKRYRPIQEKSHNIVDKIFHFYKIQLTNLYYIILLSSKIDKDLDLINAHNYPAHWLSAFINKPIIWTCNEPPFWHYYPQSFSGKLFFLPFYLIDYYLSKKIRLILCLDKRMENIIHQAYKKPTKVIGSGAELLKSNSFKKHSQFNIIFVGELHEQKRPEDILKAVAIINKKIPNIVIHLVGGGIQEQLLKKIAKNLRLNVRFYGRTSNKQLYNIFQISDLAIFVPEIQPWGIFPLEAILAGIPTIISNQTGAVDVLPRKKLHLIKTGDIKSLSHKIEYIYEHLYDEKRKTQELAKQIKNNVSWQGYGQRFLNNVNYDTD